MDIEGSINRSMPVYMQRLVKRSGASVAELESNLRKDFLLEWVHRSPYVYQRPFCARLFSFEQLEPSFALMRKNASMYWIALQLSRCCMYI